MDTKIFAKGSNEKLIIKLIKSKQLNYQNLINIHFMLSRDIWIIVASILDLPDLLSLCLVNKTFFNKIFHAESVWKNRLHDWKCTRKNHTDNVTSFEHVKKTLIEWKDFNFTFKNLVRAKGLISYGVTVLKYTHFDLVKYGLRKRKIVPKYVPPKFFKYLCDKKPECYVEPCLLNRSQSWLILEYDIGDRPYNEVVTKNRLSIDYNFDTCVFIWASKPEHKHHVSIDLSDKEWVSNVIIKWGDDQ